LCGPGPHFDKATVAVAQTQKDSIMKTTLGLALGAVLLTALVPAFGAEHEVHMLNKGADKQTMVFEPAFLAIAPGDTVRFIPTDKGHDAQTLPGMLPDGAQAFKGKV